MKKLFLLFVVVPSIGWGQSYKVRMKLYEDSMKAYTEYKSKISHMKEILGSMATLDAFYSAASGNICFTTEEDKLPKNISYGINNLYFDHYSWLIKRQFTKSETHMVYDKGGSSCSCSNRKEITNKTTTRLVNAYVYVNDVRQPIKPIDAVVKNVVKVSKVTKSIDHTIFRPYPIDNIYTHKVKPVVKVSVPVNKEVRMEWNTATGNKTRLDSVKTFKKK